MLEITDGELEEGKRNPRFYFHKTSLSVPVKCPTKSVASLITSYFYLVFSDQSPSAGHKFM